MIAEYIQSLQNMFSAAVNACHYFIPAVIASAFRVCLWIVWIARLELLHTWRNFSSIRLLPFTLHVRLTLDNLRVIRFLQTPTLKQDASMMENIHREVEKY